MVQVDPAHSNAHPSSEERRLLPLNPLPDAGGGGDPVAPIQRATR